MLRGEWAVDLIGKKPCQGQDRIERRAKFVADVGDEAALQIARLFQLFGALVQFRVKRHDAAIGFVKLTAELFDAEEQFSILIAQRRQRVARLLASENCRDIAQSAGRDGGRGRRQALPQLDDGSLFQCCGDVETIDKTLGACEPPACSGQMQIASFKDGIQIGDSRTLVRNPDEKIG